MVVCVGQVVRFFIKLICIMRVRGEGVFRLVGNGNCARGIGAGESAGAAEVEEGVDGEGRGQGEEEAGWERRRISFSLSSGYAGWGW